MVTKVTKSEGRVGDPRTIAQLLAAVPNGDYIIAVEPYKRWAKRQTRSNAQNALLWAWLTDAVPYVNMALPNKWFDAPVSAEELQLFLCHHIARELREAEGKVWMPDIRTSKLTSAQMSEFLRRAQATVAQEFGCSIPLPDDEDYALFKQQQFTNEID